MSDEKDVTEEAEQAAPPDAGEQGIIEGWPANAANLFFYNGENGLEWIMANVPWVRNPRARI